MTKIYALQHIHCETLGVIADSLAESGLSTQYIRVYGEPVPKEMGEAAGLIIMGGPMGVYEQDRFPFLADEMHLIEQSLNQNLPILGVCLGSQLIAAALGTDVHPGREKEIGWHEIFLTKPAADDFLWKGVPSPVMAYHWHGDIFEPPLGAVSLAGSALTPCQAFRYGNTAYGFLFHMEVTDGIIHKMVDTFQDEITAEGVDADHIARGIPKHLPPLQKIGRQVFSRWGQLVER